MSPREEIMLAFLGLKTGPYEVDQIRAMKAMFLLSREGDDEIRALYNFSPYHFGPFDTGVYEDLENLRDAGSVNITVSPGNRIKLYVLTPSGTQQAAKAIAALKQEDAEQLQELKTFVTSVGFTDLLQTVYRKYPDSAVNSVARV